MTVPKFSTDIVVRRLRWVVLLVMLADAVITLIGQPASFWHDPRTAREMEPLVRFFLVRGIIPYIVVGMLYIVGALFVASIMPRKVGATILFFLLLEHYFGVTSWLLYYFGDRFRLHDVFELCIAVLIVFSIYPPKQMPPNTALEPTATAP